MFNERTFYNLQTSYTSSSLQHDVPLKVYIWFKYEFHNSNSIGKNFDRYKPINVFFVHIYIDLQIFINKFQLKGIFLVVLLNQWFCD
jgi:hypothetical protein